MAGTVTRQQFAEWSFEHDRSALNMYPRKMPWGELPDDEKQIYLEEADLYLALPLDQWPTDILKRM